MVTNSQAAKETERLRFSVEAAQTLSALVDTELSLHGALAIEAPLRRPYLIYESHIQNLVKPGMKVLDLCCGTGVHSLQSTAERVMHVGADIAFEALKVASRRSYLVGRRLQTGCSDGEALPFKDLGFDIITEAGAVSYCDLDVLIREVLRLLKPGGSWIFVDSFDDNPIYRLNRFHHFLRGRRTRTVNRRIPSTKTLKILAQRFSMVTVQYFGIITFLVPVLNALVGSTSASRVVDYFDERFKFLRRFAFKIVVVARR